MVYLVSSPLARSLVTRACRHWKPNSGFFFSSARVASGSLLKNVGTGPRKKNKFYLKFNQDC